MNPYTILTRLGLFAGTAAVGAILTFGVTEIMKPAGLTSTAGARPDVVSTPDSSSVPELASKPVFAAFSIVTGAPQPVPSADPALLQIVAAEQPDPEPNANGIPRVAPVSQFDGSPLQGTNCNLAAGAMLARLGWGIVTTGGILRTLQNDQQGGTDLGDLGTALWRGYGVAPSWGAITSAQLRRLVGAGYGAVVHGLYGVFQPPQNLQPSFKGPHAIYVDAFYPGSSNTPAAYYVIDPLHKPGSGYRGEWMPAALVEAFAQGLGGPSGRIVAAWAFPAGGTPPVITDIGPLPTSGGITPQPGEPPPDPADPPVTLTTEPGDTTVELAPTPPTIDGTVTVGGTKIPKLDVCVILPKPVACPGGIIGRYGSRIPIRLGSLFPTIDIRFVDSTKPNLVLVGFTISSSAPADVLYWKVDGSGGVLSAGSFSSISLPGGQPVLVARLETVAATAYRFQVVAGGIIGAKSAVGAFTTGAGLKALDLGLTVIDQPRMGIDLDAPIYSRLLTDRLAPPVLPCTDGTAGTRILLGGRLHCLAPAEAPAPPSCVAVKVGYELVGLSGQVAVRATPGVTAVRADGASAEEAVIEALGSPGADEVTLGCLTPGIGYVVTLDILGDPLGPLATRKVTVPAS
jgi:hypothetical protein